MGNSALKIKIISGIFIGVMLGACSFGGANSNANKTSLSRNESQRNLWIGRTKEELIAKLGKPRNVFTAPGSAGRVSTILVYPRATAPAQKCIDAFVITKANGKISNYYCR